MTSVQSCRKNKFVKGFFGWLYLACVAKAKARMGERGHDEEVAFSKKLN